MGLNSKESYLGLVVGQRLRHLVGLVAHSQNNCGDTSLFESKDNEKNLLACSLAWENGLPWRVCPCVLLGRRLAFISANNVALQCNLDEASSGHLDSAFMLRHEGSMT